MKRTRTVTVTRIRREIRLAGQERLTMMRCPHCGGELTGVVALPDGTLETPPLASPQVPANSPKE